MDVTSSKTLADTLQNLEANPALRTTLMPLVTKFILRAMQLAVYFCTGCPSRNGNFGHYALSVPFYTHFTSPIRRYPDLIVHRLLAAALGYAPKPKLTPGKVEEIAMHCNETKYAAKMASEASCEIYFDSFIKVSLFGAFS